MSIAEDLAAALDADHERLFESYLESLEGEDVESTVEVGSQFQIADPASAEWALRKIRKAQQLIAERNAAAQEQIDAVLAEVEKILAPIRENRDEENAKNEQTVRFFTQLLNTYHRKLLAEDPNRKTIKLAFGTLSARQQQAKYTFGPEFIEWALANEPDLVRAKYEVEAVKAKAALTLVENADHELAATLGDELVPGVEIEPAEVKFSVSTEVKK